MSTEVALPKSIVRNVVVASSAFQTCQALASFDDVHEAIMKLQSVNIFEPVSTSPRVLDSDPVCTHCNGKRTVHDRQGYYVCLDCGACLAAVRSSWIPPSSDPPPKKPCRDVGDPRARRPVPSYGSSERMRHEDDVLHWATLAGVPVAASRDACARVARFGANGNSVTMPLIVAALVLATTPLPSPGDIESRMRQKLPIVPTATQKREQPRFACDKCGTLAFCKRDARFHCKFPSSMPS